MLGHSSKIFGCQKSTHLVSNQCMAIFFSSAAKRFDTDLTPRKSSIKIMIQDELTKLADEEDDEEEEGDAEKDVKKPSGKGVKA